MKQAAERQKRANQAIDLRIGTTYIWALVPVQPNATEPATIKPLKVESATAELAERVSNQLINDGTLAIEHAPQLIRMQLDGPLSPLWEKGHVAVGELWKLYTTYPYLPRLSECFGSM